ncbi:MAG: pyridoxal 5'-phosphate synthase glutaminase subunit PdxT [candidate division Zixibacteria bacterium]|nr:pyridoxal 5'-phosphate synthase glutaminase subunit PdxT [candidate division Zixibacteria bacterium]
MFTALHIGVLALQGDFERHLHHVHLLHAATREVRRGADLDGLDALIIPGGESTTIHKLIDRFAMRDILTGFLKQHPVWGTCAGSILLAREVDDDRITPFGIIDVAVSRNAYGRQVHSFFASVNARLGKNQVILPASFIRAPIVSDPGPDVCVLAEYEGHPVLLEQRDCLISTFHTELHDDPMLTRYFLEKVLVATHGRSDSSAYRSAS